MQLSDFFIPQSDRQYQHQPTSGSPSPLGATPTPRGTNFALFSQHAKRVQLLLFEDPTRPEPTQKIDLSPRHNKTGDIWHVFVPDVQVGARYGYRVAGKHWADQKFDVKKVLLDPYARAIDRTWYDRATAVNYKHDNLRDSLRGIVVPTTAQLHENYQQFPSPTSPFTSASTPEQSNELQPHHHQGQDQHQSQEQDSQHLEQNLHALTADPFYFDWRGTKNPQIDPAKLIIYELHPKGFTANPNSRTSASAPIPQLKEKLSYLKNLGVNAVELLPMQAFDNDLFGKTYHNQPLTNYWGYSTLSYFALHDEYFSTKNPATQFQEFKEFVRAAHSQNIAVILDVVYNHTTEGNHQGPTLSFRGIDNQVYYISAPDDRYYYQDYTGCGHTFNANHPQVTRFIVDSLEYFVEEFHIDGFRFDLGACFYYNQEGYFMGQPHVITAINESPILANTLLIAEPWDATGLNLLGNFGSNSSSRPDRWLEWNGEFRDLTRRLVARNELQIAPAWTQTFWGDTPRFLPEKSNQQAINFVTCHDGFTLFDLVSYSTKHNEANGFDNQDGADENYSTNSGAEGQTNLPEVNEIRSRQIRNFLTLLLLSRGSVLLNMGDEVGRTQWGNNNAFNQDNLNSYFDWDQVERNDYLLDFTRSLIKLRTKLKLGEKLAHAQIVHTCFENQTPTETPQIPDCLVMNLELSLPEEDATSRQHLCLVFNPTTEPQWADLSQLAQNPEHPWRQIIDTNNVAPYDFISLDLAQPIIDQKLFLVPHSLKVLVDF